MASLNVTYPVAKSNSPSTFAKVVFSANKARASLSANGTYDADSEFAEEFDASVNDSE